MQEGRVGGRSFEWECMNHGCGGMNESMRVEDWFGLVWGGNAV